MASRSSSPCCRIWAGAPPARDEERFLEGDVSHRCFLTVAVLLHSETLCFPSTVGADHRLNPPFERRARSVYRSDRWVPLSQLRYQRHHRDRRVDAEYRPHSTPRNGKLAPLAQSRTADLPPAGTCLRQALLTPRNVL